MARYPFATAIMSAGCLLASHGTALASPSAAAQSTVQIVQPGGIFVVQDILGRVNAALLIKASQGDAISLAVPVEIDLSSPVGETLSLLITTRVSGTGTSLPCEVISVSIGVAAGAARRTEKEGWYRGSMTVLAQYN